MLKTRSQDTIENSFNINFFEFVKDIFICKLLTKFFPKENVQCPCLSLNFLPDIFFHA